MTTTNTPPIDVERVLNEGRWTDYQQWLVFLTALTIVFDGFDNQLLGVALPTIMREWSVGRADFAPVVSLGYLGMMIGGTLAGYAGDRIGRRNALLGCMVLFGVTTIVVAGAHDVSTLGILRLLAGIGLGGAMPNAAALAAEYVPLRQRPFAVTLAIVCVPVGATLAGFAGDRRAAHGRVARAVHHRRGNADRRRSGARLRHARVAAVPGQASLALARAGGAADAEWVIRLRRMPPSRSRRDRRPAGGRRWRRSSAAICASTPSRCGRRFFPVCWPSTWVSPGCPPS